MFGFEHVKKKKRFVRLTSLLLVSAISLTFTACGSGSEADPTSTEQAASGENVVFCFQGNDILKGEVYLYAESVIEDYVKTYGPDIWSMNVLMPEGQEQSLRALTRKDVIENIVKVKVLVAKANDYGVSLSTEDKKKIEADTEAFWKNLTDIQIEDTELSRDQVKVCMEDNVLAAKVYAVIMEQAGIEISDERARETTFYDLYFPFYTENSDGVVQPMDEAAKKEQYDKAVQAYDSLISPLDTGTERDPAVIAAYYGLMDTMPKTMTPEEVRSEYGKEVADKIYALEDGATSLVTETEYGYHLFCMKALTDRVATDKRKAEMEREEQNKYFSKLYTQWLKEIDPNYHYEESVNFDVYDQITF